MKIHGLVYLIVGSFIIGFSYYITSVNNILDLQKFMLFVWVGVIFVIVGGVKLIVAAFSRGKPKIAKENFPHHHSTHSHNKPSHAKFCTQCGSALRQFDKFCYKCGNRIFK